MADPPERSFVDRAVVAGAVRRAVQHAGLSERESSGAMGRARLAGLLPTATVRVIRGLTAGSQYQTLTSAERLTQDDSLALDFRVVFRLDRLAFDRYEVGLQRLELVRADRRAALAREIVELLTTLELDRLARSRAVDTGRESPELPTVADALLARARLESLTGEDLERLVRAR